MSIPTYDNLFNPLLEALRILGGSGTNSEIDDTVAQILKLSESEVNEVHRGNLTKLAYRLAWARNYLKRFGLVENSARGVWSLTPKGLATKEVDKSEVKKFVKQRVQVEVDGKETDLEDSEDESKLWQDELLEVTLRLSPSAFERLCQRVLRESGFIQVEVTGRSGDGGIDGRGVIRIGGFLSFHVFFQCKRYHGSVSAQQIRDFRGAMTGRAEKGLFITTGTFTRDAKQEASRDGAPPIDLVDGEQLVEKMRELGLGVRVKTSEAVEIDRSWFSGI